MPGLRLLCLPRHERRERERAGSGAVHYSTILPSNESIVRFFRLNPAVRDKAEDRGDDV